MTPAVLTLVEREEEQQTIFTALSAAAQGVGRLLLVEGDDGLGKTRLLRLARAQAIRSGHPAALVHAAPAESEIPYTVARRLVQALLVRTKGERAAVLAAAGDTAAILLEEASPTEAGLAGEQGIESALLRVVARLAAGGPVLIALDDAHAADHDSLRFLDLLAHRIGIMPVVLLFARRPAVPTSVQLELDELSHRADATVLRLSPLSEQGAVFLTQRFLGPDSAGLAAAAHHATAGNPRLLGELLEAARQDGRRPEDVAGRLPEVLPATLHRWSEQRLSGHSDDQRALLEAAAALGDGAALEDVTRVMGTTAAVADGAAAELLRHGVLRTADPIVMEPPLLRWVVLEQMGQVRRREVHAAAAKVFATDGRMLDASSHLLALPPAGSGWSVHCLRQGARTALANGDVALAVRLLRHGAEEPPPSEARPELLLELGTALLLVRPRAAVLPLEEAGFETDDPHLSARATLLLAEAQRLAGDGAEAAVRLKVLAATSAGPLEAERREASATLSRPLWERNASPQVGAAVEPPAGPARSRTDRMVLTSRALEALAAGGRAADVVDGIERALGAGILADEPLAANLHLVHAIGILAACGRAEAAINHADHALADPRMAGADLLTAAVRAGRAWALLHRDRLHEARADADAALAYLAEHAPILVGTALDPAVRTRLAQGEVVEAQQLLISVWAPGTVLDLGGLARLARARVVLAGGDLRHGVEALLDARARLAAPAANESVTPGAADAVDALIAVGDIDRAGQVATGLLARQRAFGEPRGLGLALRAAAAVATEPRERIDLLEEAAAALSSAAAPVERALVLVRRAEALESSGHREEARELVRVAADLAITHGATPVQAEASRRLVSLGGRPRSARPAGADELSPAERRVAELAAEGRSNRAVAAELVVSVKTVEMHLSKAYRKLAISSRAELALALRG